MSFDINAMMAASKARQAQLAAHQPKQVVVQAVVAKPFVASTHTRIAGKEVTKTLVIDAGVKSLVNHETGEVTKLGFCDRRRLMKEQLEAKVVSTKKFDKDMYEYMMAH